MVLFAVNLADQYRIDHLCQEARAEVVRIHVREEQPDRRVERDGEEGRNRHREVLRIGERLEEAALLPLEREDRNESDRDDEQREEARPAHLLDRADDDVFVTAGSPRAVPVFELLVRLLDHDDRRVHHRPNGDRDPPRLIMFAVWPVAYIGTDEMMIVTGMVMMGTSADGMCQRKSMITMLTMISSSIRVPLSVSTARSINSARS